MAQDFTKIKEQIFFSPEVWAKLFLMAHNKPKYRSPQGVLISKLVSDIVEKALSTKGETREQKVEIIRQAARKEKAICEDSYDIPRCRSQRLKFFLD